MTLLLTFLSAIEMIFEGLCDIILPIGVCVVLPLMVIRYRQRTKMNETNRRADIIMAAIERNPDVNVDEYLRKITPPQPSAEERLRMRLHKEVLWGSLLLTLGLIWAIAAGISMLKGTGWREDIIIPLCTMGVPCLAIGTGLLVAYHSGKRHLPGAGQPSETEAQQD